jgi:hypothetical protein
MKSIRDLTKVVRSKNCSPFELTLDIIFRERSVYEALKARKAIDAELIARIYGINRDRIKKVIWFDPAAAVKITMRREVSSGSPGDSDVYGAQQHAPLLKLEFEV